MAEKQSQLAWHIFCKVIDNYGDIGVCWRLAKQLLQLQQQVFLWVDDLACFQAICAQVNPQLAQQIVQKAHIYHWQQSLPADSLHALKQADVVVEAFACELPSAVIAVMQQQTQQASWLNLEYLTAEQWAQDCHLLPSPVQGLQKHFFFPGFTKKTGGLLWEEELLDLPATMQTQSAREHLFAELEIATELAAIELQVSLFSYENTAVEELLDAFNSHYKKVHLLVPQGRIQQQVEQWQSTNEERALTISIVPFMPQPSYDCLLASCQLNFVRGEESFVRAQMLGLPLIWHIYQQQEDAHLVKLEAFLQAYLDGVPQALQETLLLAFQRWNQNNSDVFQWALLLEQLSDWKQHAQAWQKQQIANGSLAQNLVQFAQTRYSATHF